MLTLRLQEGKVDVGFKVDFFPSEEEKTSTSLGNKIYDNGISRRKSIETYKGHNCRNIFSRKQTRRIWSSRCRLRKTELGASSSPSVCTLL
jgi:hypothetical protein